MATALSSAFNSMGTQYIPTRFPATPSRTNLEMISRQRARVAAVSPHLLTYFPRIRASQALPLRSVWTRADGGCFCQESYQTRSGG